MHFKKIMGIITLSTALLLSACGNNAAQNPISTGTPTEQVEVNKDTTNNSSSGSSLLGYEFTPEDDHQALAGEADVNILLETESGIFYTRCYTPGPDLHYYDKGTKKSIFLCNKPECPHDGNEFCAATNNKYSVLSATAYNNKIVMLALDNSSAAQIQYKILIASLDGSKLEEYMTIYSSDSYDLGTPHSPNRPKLIIHRNKLFANISLVSSETANITDAPRYRGMAIVDLATKECSFISETPVSEDNPEIQNIIGLGNYVFYSTVSTTGKPAKKSLCKYDVTTGETVTYNPQGFRGTFALLNEDQIAYCRPSSQKATIYTLSKNTAKDYLVTYTPPRYREEHTIRVHDPLNQDGPIDYEEVVPAHWEGSYTADFQLIFADEDHIYISHDAWLGVTKYALETRDNQIDSSLNYVYFDYIWRYDKDLAHYVESETTYFIKDEDPTTFGKDPGNEFDCVEEMTDLIDRKDNVEAYYFTIYKDKVILQEWSFDENYISHYDYYITTHDKFFSGKPEWQPYLSY